jgi:hypothetical protein
LKYSRFWETATGDRVRSGLGGGRRILNSDWLTDPAELYGVGLKSLVEFGRARESHDLRSVDHLRFRSLRSLVVRLEDFG